MNLYVNGDSHSAGHDAGGPAYSYGKHIADWLSANFVCDAIAGCSNDSIISRTLAYLENNTPDYIIIGWSTWERETWRHGDISYNITASGVDSVHPDLRAQYKQWVVDSAAPEFQHRKEEENYTKIWQLHQLLKSKNIPHLFFNCYSHFYYVTTHNKHRYDWLDCYVDPYDQWSTYYFWLERKGYTPANPKFYHYGADAHVAWAEFLLPYIKKL